MVAEAEVFGAFGGVFGDVAGSVFGGQLAGRSAVDGLDVDLFTEAQHQRESRCLDGESHVCGGLTDGVGELGGIDTDLWRLVVLARAVEPDESVEVDHAAALELRDLGKRHPTLPAELGCGQAGLVGEGATDGDGESAP